jgi:hypothetical protein
MIAAAIAGVRFWRTPRPPTPSAARLPADVRILLQPFRKDTFALPLAANGETQYRIAMQAGATLVYSWTASQGMVSCRFADQRPAKASEAHGAFVAQSSGWYRWRWNNPTGDSITIRLKLSGYYEPQAAPPAGMPPAGMTYDR